MKYAILLVVVLCAFVQIRPIAANDIDDLLKKLEAAVDKAVAEAKNKLEKAKAEVNRAAQAAESAAKVAMQHAENEFKKQLDALKQKAKNAGVNIDECLGADETKLINLPTEGTNQMVSCVAGKINHVFDIAEQALDKIQKVVDEVANIHQEIKNCGHGIHSVTCLAKLATKITKDIIDLPDAIEKVATEAVNLILNVKDEVKGCANNAVNTVESEGKALLEKIGLCVTNKIIHH